MEVIVRLGADKYKGPGKVKTFTEATSKLIEECLIPNHKQEPWQEFRDELLWTLDVDELFSVNLENLRKVYESYFTIIAKWMDLEECFKLN